MQQKIANDRFKNALHGVAQDVPPIWMMRQAGRYHGHYQALRQKHSFMELCKNSELAAEVAWGPVQDFDFDVAILFSDLLFPLEALGMGLSYDPAPALGWHLRPETIANLKTLDQALPELEFQRIALQATRAKLPADKSLIGFVGGPWTLFTYAVEGSHKGSLIETKRHLALWPRFAELMTGLLIENIRLQLEGGAEVVMIFDTASGELSPDLFQSLIAPHLKQMMERFPGRLGYYSKGTTPAHLKHPVFQEGAWAGLGFDHRFDLVEELSRPRTASFTQGNFDQALLFLPREQFRETLLNYLEPLRRLSAEERAGWVCGLGHGILPQTPTENVRLFVQTVREVFTQ